LTSGEIEMAKKYVKGYLGMCKIDAYSRNPTQELMKVYDEGPASCRAWKANLPSVRMMKSAATRFSAKGE
jgi:hypothetical protein